MKRNLFGKVHFSIDGLKYVIECTSTAIDDGVVICSFYRKSMFDELTEFAIEHELDMYRYSDVVAIYIPLSSVFSFGQFADSGEERLEVYKD